jgi:hypothetical protein
LNGGAGEGSRRSGAIDCACKWVSGEMEPANECTAITYSNCLKATAQMNVLSSAAKLSFENGDFERFGLNLFSNVKV